MRRNRTLICLAAALGLALLPTAARAASIFHFQGEAAHAYFTGVDPTGCIYTSADVNMYEDRSQQPPRPPQRGSWGTLYLYQYDYCQDLALLHGEGTVQLSGDAFVVSGGLQAARATTVVTLHDYISGGPLQASLDLTWTATGELFHGGGRNNLKGPGYSSVSRYTGSSREAQTTGAVLVGSKSIDVGTQVYGLIQSSQSGTIYRDR